MQQQRQQEGHSDHCQTRHVIPVNPEVVLEELVKFVPPARKGVVVHRVHETTRVGQLGWRRVQLPQVIRRAQSRDDHKHLRGYLVELTSSCLGGDLPVGANVGRGAPCDRARRRVVDLVAQVERNHARIVRVPASDCAH